MYHICTRLKKTTTSAMDAGLTVSGSKVWWVVVFCLLGVTALGDEQQSSRRGTYACWGGCYNECVLQEGKEPSERVPCFLGCLGSCFDHLGSDLLYYCRLGCSLVSCVRYRSDGGNLDGCLQNCSSNACRSSAA
ncbi:uncharacterized protein LOC127813894 [Diospyros lotus]|uniref:uncharacterized protein LOC127813894 n=1 Tax=Diospyros lotus TaxID=55363 RepID=UPI00224F3745|nr:uncharacterized protein LOC127813894 [Diospyros lotus]